VDQNQDVRQGRRDEHLDHQDVRQDHRDERHQDQDGNQHHQDERHQDQDGNQHHLDVHHQEERDHLEEVESDDHLATSGQVEVEWVDRQELRRQDVAVAYQEEVVRDLQEVRGEQLVAD
jgi:hypothetical protein